MVFKVRLSSFSGWKFFLGKEVGVFPSFVYMFDYATCSIGSIQTALKAGLTCAHHLPFPISYSWNYSAICVYSRKGFPQVCD